MVHNTQHGCSLETRGNANIKRLLCACDTWWSHGTKPRICVTLCTSWRQINMFLGRDLITLRGSDSHLCVVIGLGQLTHQSWHKGMSSLPSVWLRPQHASNIQYVSHNFTFLYLLKSKMIIDAGPHLTTDTRHMDCSWEQWHGCPA